MKKAAKSGKGRGRKQGQRKKKKEKKKKRNGSIMTTSNGRKNLGKVNALVVVPNRVLQLR